MSKVEHKVKYTRKLWRSWDTPKLGLCCVPGCPNPKGGGTDGSGSFGSSNCQSHMVDIDIKEEAKKLKRKTKHNI
jgi:hypothetical protein